MSTLPDPRSQAMTPASERPSSRHPDLNDEVATLSNKLINAINHGTNLDDTLSATRCELDSSKERLQQLEAKVKSHEYKIARGILIEKSVADFEKAKVIAELQEERRRRLDVEKEKKGIELELENLTTALFEEANNMVTSAREKARKELEIANRRSEQLRNQVADTEVLLKSHQEQLAQLKLVMEHMSDDRTMNSTAPPTPGLSKVDSKEEFGVDSVDNLTINEDLRASYPTSFTHLLHPVLRTDLASYDEFIALVRLAKATIPGSRISSGSYGSLSIGLGLYIKSHSQAPSNVSNPSTSNGSSPVTPNTPLSAGSAASAQVVVSIPLSDTQFYRRALSEDIEPCLRLDTAPGISWMARRSMLKSLCDGNLAVEPMPTSTKKFSLTFSCSLCGEHRDGQEFSRNHRFRISESANAQRYPLCEYCTKRIRSCCAFANFLRMLKDGHWRAEGEEAEKAAWVESVRLRESMFWCRIGGGVLPGPFPPSKDVKSPRDSEDSTREQEAKISEEFQRTGEIQPKDVTPITELANVAGVDAMSTSAKANSVSSADSRRPSLASIDGRRPSASSNSRTSSASSESRRPSIASTSNEVRRPSVITISRKASVSSIATVSRKASISSITSRPPMPTPPPMMIKRPSTVETKATSTTEFKLLSPETSRPVTAPTNVSSKVSSMRKKFELFENPTPGTWQAAQEDAAAPAPTKSKPVLEPSALFSTDDTNTSGSSQTTLKANSSPGDSDNERKLSITIPGFSNQNSTQPLCN